MNEPFVCHDENAVLTPDGCVQIEDLTGTEIILATWDCHVHGNGICGTEVGIPLVTQREALPRTSMESDLAALGFSLIIIGTYLKRRFA
jgi:hypothetical protein